MPPPLPGADQTIEEPVQAIDPSLSAPKSKEAEELARIADLIERRRASKPPREQEPESEPSLLGWVTMLVLFGVVGFIAMSAISRGCASDSSRDNASVVDAAATQTDAATAAFTDEETDDSLAAPPRPEELAFGETLTTVDAGPNLHVGHHQGLLVIEAADGPAPEVFIGARSLGQVPLRAALDEGRYELKYVRGDEESYRFVYVRAGQTRVIPPL